MLHTHSSLQAMPERFRATFINSLSGAKSANLIGTQNQRGQTNLAMMSSAVHLGANPPLLALIVRPDRSPRHTLHNILETGFYTLNHVNHDIIVPAHQTSARYDEDISEFSATGLTEEWLGDFPAPFVAEAKIKLGLQLKEETRLTINDTHFVIGEIILVSVPDELVGDSGYVNIQQAGSVAVSGLDSYHALQPGTRLSYAKPDTIPIVIE